LKIRILNQMFKMIVLIQLNIPQMIGVLLEMTSI